MFNQKLFIRFITLGGMLISLVIAGCATKEVSWGDPQMGLFLRYNIRQGQTLNYTRKKETTQSMEMTHQSMKTIKNSVANYIIKGSGTDDKNNIKAQVIINDLIINADSPQGQINPDTSSLKGKGFGITFYPKGKEVESTGIDELPLISTGQPNGPGQSAKDFFLNLLPELPPDNIKIGDTWGTPIDNKNKQGSLELTTRGETTSVLDGLETIQGMECIRIKSDSKSTVKGSGKIKGQDIKVDGNVNASSTWYFAYEKGIFVKASLEEDADMKINLGTMEEMPQTTKSKTTVELVH